MESLAFDIIVRRLVQWNKYLRQNAAFHAAVSFLLTALNFTQLVANLYAR